MSRLFDGSFRSRPTVSLRGQSKREESKEDLVLKAQQVRRPGKDLCGLPCAADTKRRFLAVLGRPGRHDSTASSCGGKPAPPTPSKSVPEA